jgi:hypothetical protein
LAIKFGQRCKNPEAQTSVGRGCIDLSVGVAQHLETNIPSIERIDGIDKVVQVPTVVFDLKIGYEGICPKKVRFFGT